MSEEGQQVFRDQDLYSHTVNPNVPARDPGLRDEAAKLRTHYFTPEKIDASMNRWLDVFNQYFR